MFKGIFSVLICACVCVHMGECVCGLQSESRAETQRENPDLCSRTHRDEALRALLFLRLITKPTVHSPHDPKLHHGCIKQNTFYNPREHF